MKSLTSVMQSQIYIISQHAPVEVARDRFSRPLYALIEGLSVGSVRIRLCKNVAIAVFVEGMLHRISMGR